MREMPLIPFKWEVTARIKELVPKRLRADWQVAPGVVSRVALELNLVHRAAFEFSTAEPRAGRLPGTVRRVETSAELRAKLDGLLRSAEKRTGTRLARWLATKPDVTEVPPREIWLEDLASYGFEFPCEHCGGRGCELRGVCAGTGWRHVTATLRYHPSREHTIALRDVPKDAHPVLRAVRDLDTLRSLARFVRTSKPTLERDVLQLRYVALVEVVRSDVFVRGEKYGALAYGRKRKLRDHGLTAQHVLDPLQTNLRRALDWPDEVHRCASAARAFFRSELHARLRSEKPKHRELIAEAQRERLISAEYVEQATAVAGHAEHAMVEQLERHRGWMQLFWMLFLPCAVALALHRLVPSRMLALGLTLVSVVLTCEALGWLIRLSARAVWGVPVPSEHRKPVPAALLCASAVLAGALAAVPISLWSPRSAVAADGVSGLYGQGAERLLVVAPAKGRLALRHVDAAAGCSERAELTLSQAGDYELAGTPYLRRDGAAFVLLPDPNRHCGERLEPVRFELRKPPLDCRAVEGARWQGLQGARGGTLRADVPIQVLPWQRDAKRVLVRGPSWVGTVRTSDVRCDGEALSKLQRGLFER